MDAVVLANYANEHAPFAIKCLNAVKHVYSEVLPVQNMKEAVELIEAIEKPFEDEYREGTGYVGKIYEKKTENKEGELI